MLRWFHKELVQILLLALPFAFAAVWWHRIPPTVISHWNAHGQPDGTMSKGPGLLLLPVFNVALGALLTFLPRIDPRLRRNPDAHTLRQHRLWRVYRCALVGFFAVIALAIIVIAAGWHLDMGRLCCNAALVLLAVVGNFIGNLEPNYLLGIRTPWTLEDDATWRATHRLGGYLMVSGALAVLVAGFFVSDLMLLALLMAYIIGLSAWGVGYSAWHFRRQTRAA